MNKVVLDTNVLVSALLANGPPSAIVDLIANGKLIPFYNDLIISEYWDVLKRPKFNFHSFQVFRLIDDIVKSGIVAEIHEPSDMPMIDEDDRKFYDVAKAALAFLISGNIRHFPPEPFIVTPVGFLRHYDRSVQEFN
jgi:putative PIN family toxin of toxin-antitoxin system